MAQDTKKQAPQQQSSQDPAEGRRDILDDNPSKRVHETKPKSSANDKSGNVGVTPNEDPAEGRRDIG